MHERWSTTPLQCQTKTIYYELQSHITPREKNGRSKTWKERPNVG